ncbi:glycosyltransferase family 39 protein [Haloarcula argentinensis]|nr:glycosyltransferase family 39 protein [Haloarcula argentinensis]
MDGKVMSHISSYTSNRMQNALSQNLSILILTLLAVILRLGRLTATTIHPGLRNDGPFTLRLVQHGFLEIIELTAQDVHPPFYYFVARLWGLVFGMTIPSLRLLGVAFGALSVPLLYLVARRLVPENAALVSAALLATSTFHIFQSQKARMYSLLLFLALISTYYYLNLIQTGDRRSVSLYIIVTVAMAYTHVFAAFVVLFHTFDFVFRMIRSNEPQHTAQFGLSIVGIGFLTLPWLAVFVNQIQSRSGDFWIPEPTLYTVIWSAGIAYAGNYVFALVFGAAFVSVAIGLMKGYIPWRAVQLPALWMIIPTSVPFILSFIISPIFITRYTITALPGIFILVGLGVSLQQKSIRSLFYAVMATLAVINLWIYYAQSRLGPWLIT